MLFRVHTVRNSQMISQSSMTTCLQGSHIHDRKSTLESFDSGTGRHFRWVLQLTGKRMIEFRYRFERPKALVSDYLNNIGPSLNAPCSHIESCGATLAK